MSYYFRSIPKNIALFLHDRYNLEIFVETGTYAGISSEWASKHFFQVHTIEYNEEYYKASEFRLMTIPNVVMYMNDSRLVLPGIMEYIENKGSLFYLDAHWSEGAHYGRPLKDSVAIDEILLINQWENKNHAIIVDDAHRFGTDGWPTKLELIDSLKNNGKRNVRELLDVFIATPKRRYFDACFDAPSIERIQVGRIGN